MHKSAKDIHESMGKYALQVMVVIVITITAHINDQLHVKVFTDSVTGRT